MLLRPLLALLAFALAACDGPPGETTAGADPTAVSSAHGAAPGNSADTAPYAGIGPEETVHFTGTEPFWDGEAVGSTLTYSTPEDIDGTTIEVERFAGRNGVSLSGQLDGAPLDLAITPAECSDGMSDRRYPFVVTLQVRGEQRQGCAWTAARPFSGSERP